ncbi:MAG TPA: hypothetical protein VGG14_18235 [Candidatus Sulfotelmatobacter sp.]
MDRTNSFALGMGFPGREHVLDQAVRNSTVLIEEYHPGIALAVSPADALIQGLGNAQVFPILDQLKSEKLLLRAQRAKLFEAGAVVYYHQPLHLSENRGNVFEHPGTRVVCNDYRTNRPRKAFVSDL